MLGFLLAAAALVCATVLLLLRPWQRRRTEEVASVREINAGVYRDQLNELERDLAAGTIASADHAQAKAELQRRLLDDTAVVDAPSRQTARKPTTTVVLALTLPLLAAALYAWLGTPAALQPRQAPPAQQVSAKEIDQMLNALAARLQNNPDDPQGWTMLARSYRILSRLEEAQNAFTRIGEGLYRDPVLLAEYADVLAARAGGALEGRPLELVMAALKLDPDSGMALSLAATAAYQRRDFPQATAYWQRLLKQLPADSEDAQWLRTMLADMRAATDATTVPATATATAPAASISGRVSLAPALAAQTLPTDTVFVFARAADGPRMPLAVQRARVADLPLNFKLDDSMAVSPQFKLSGVPQVRIEARISRSGDATPAAGDLIGASGPVALGAANVVLRIDQVRP